MRLRLPILACLLAACRTVPEPEPLQQVHAWAVQLQGLDREGAVDRLAAAPVDLLVLEQTRTVRGREDFPIAAIVARLRRDKLCFAYVNVGQAEEYRAYWRNFWKAPTAEEPGSPPYLLTVDPEGWAGNYPVAFWDPRWKAILWGSADALVDQAIADGFDGVYLDWILGYRDETVAEAARRRGIDPARAMAELVRDLRDYARRRKPGFFVIAQNGADLPERVPEFLDWIDGFSQESLSFHGNAGAKWEEPEAGDFAVPAEGEWSTRKLSERLTRIRAHGLPVFTLDYAADPENARIARERSAALGFLPFVSRTPLDRLPE